MPETCWRIQIFSHLVNWKLNFLTHAFQGIQEEALRRNCSLTVRTREYYQRHSNPPPLQEEVLPETQAVIFLGIYDFRPFRPPPSLPSCGIEIDNSYDGLLSPVSLDPFAAAELAAGFFRRRGIRRVMVHQLVGDNVCKTRGDCFRLHWERYGTCEIKNFLPWSPLDQSAELPDDPALGHFFTGGTWCDEKLKSFRARHQCDAVRRLAVVSCDGKSLLIPGYEPVSTIGIDWHAAGRAALREILRRLEEPGAEAHRIYLIPKLHEVADAFFEPASARRDDPG